MFLQNVVNQCEQLSSEFYSRIEIPSTVRVAPVEEVPAVAAEVVPLKAGLSTWAIVLLAGTGLFLISKPVRKRRRY